MSDRPPGTKALVPKDRVLGSDLAALLDVPRVAALLEAFTHATALPVFVLDLKGNVIVGDGWRDICERFHHESLQTAEKCRKHDRRIAGHVAPGEVKAFRCTNDLVDVVTPLIIDRTHVGNVHAGQFLYKDDVVDRRASEAKAVQCGFERDAYLEALDRVPRLSQDEVKRSMRLLVQIVTVLADNSFTSLRLRESEARYRHLYDTAPDMLVSVDAAARIKRCNQTVLNTLGYAENELLGQPIFTFYHSESIGGAKEILAASQETNVGTRDAELQLKRKDGTKIDVSSTVSSGRDAQGNIVESHWVWRDISALKHTEALLAQVGAIGRIGGWEMAVETGEATWTRATYDIVEIEPGQPVPDLSQHIELYQPEYRPIAREAMRALIEDDVPLELEAPIRTALGNVKWCRTIGDAVREDGKCVLVRGVFQDVHEHAMARRELREQEAKFRGVFESTAVGVVFTDTDGNIEDANDTFLELVGYSRRDLHDGLVNWREMTPPEYADLDARALQELATGRVASPFEKEYIRKDGTRVAVLVAAAVLSGETGRGFAVIVDQTDLKREELRRRASERRHQQYIEHSPDGVFVADEHGHFVEVNPAACRITGYGEEELAAMSVPDLLYDEGGLNHFRTAIRDGYAEGEVPFRHKSGEIRWWWVSAVKLSSTRIIGFTTDTTKRRQAEEALRESEKQKKLALQGGGLGTWDWHVDTGAVAYNERWATMKGYRLDEIEQSLEQFRDLVHPEDMAATDERMNAHLRGNTEGYESRFRMRTKSGEWIWILDRGKVVERDGEGRPTRVCGTHQDITARQLAQKALVDSQEGYRTLVAGLPDIVMRFDRDGRHLFVSDNVRDSVGIQAERFIGRTHRELELPEAQCEVWEGAISRVFGSGEVVETEYSFESVEGPATFDLRLFPEFDQEETVQTVLAISRNITAQRRLERERSELEAKLLQNQRLEAIGTLASGVAHEINNPINGVLNYAQLIMDGTDAEALPHSHAREIIKETERVANIVRNLLAFSRHDKQTHSPASISDIITSSLSLIRAVIRQDQIKLVVDVADALPKLECRSQQIQQVLMNLLTNARDALNDRYPKFDDNKVLSVAAAEVVRDGRRWIRIAVEDRGAGIAPDDEGRIFEPFFTTKGREKGTGLGLAITHGIVHDHHGDIDVLSRVGLGTKVSVELPVDRGWSSDEEKPLSGAER